MLKVKWKNNKIDEDYLQPYLKDFGQTLFNQTKNLIDIAMIEENKKEKLIHDAYDFFIGNTETDDSTFFENETQFNEFKELITELIAHANEYNEINSKFFGRDSLMIKVIFLV